MFLKVLKSRRADGCSELFDYRIVATELRFAACANRVCVHCGKSEFTEVNLGKEKTILKISGEHTGLKGLSRRNSVEVVRQRMAMA